MVHCACLLLGLIAGSSSSTSTRLGVISVNFHVITNTSFPGKQLATFLAFERFFAGMYTKMVVEMATMIELTATGIAFEGALT